MERLTQSQPENSQALRLRPRPAVGRAGVGRHKGLELSRQVLAHLVQPLGRDRAAAGAGRRGLLLGQQAAQFTLEIESLERAYNRLDDPLSL